MAHHVRQIEEVYRRASEFDVIHFHIDYLHYPVSSRLGANRVTTLHGRLDLPDLEPLYRAFPGEPVVSISNDQRAPLPWLNWQSTIHHGLPTRLLRPSVNQGKYLAFLGRISPEKRPDRAIELAQRTGFPLKIAAKVDRADHEYFESKIKPLLKDSSVVEYIGEIGDQDKARFLGDAAGLVFPIDWPEPFGLVMIEAMACGTPVLAWRRGSVAEVIEDGVTGFIVDDMDEAEAALAKLVRLDRRRCRARFEARFSVARMARDYVETYRRVSWATGQRESAAAAS
jgi:glycosyltransferase involved in cell wall biosynthesis